MNDEQAPLFTECGRCGGRGYWTPPPEVRGNSRTMFGREDCSDCDGLGVVVSALGSEVVELIKRLRSKGRL